MLESRQIIAGESKKRKYETLSALILGFIYSLHGQNFTNQRLQKNLFKTM